MHIGIAGIGKMGAAMAQRLIEVGHKVTVWNRSAGKLKPVTDAGAAVAATPAELAKNADAVITILTDAAAIDTVYNGASGLLSGDVRGKLFIEMSTVQPQTVVALAEKVRAKGAALVECPVGGSTGPARQGKLIGLMGAEPADAARGKPILDQLCRQARALRAGRLRRGHEAHHQHAADDLLAGAGRGAGALPAAGARPRADHGSAVRHVGRPERAQGARRPGSRTCSRAATAVPSPSTSTAR